MNNSDIHIDNVVLRYDVLDGLGRIKGGLKVSGQVIAGAGGQVAKDKLA